MITAKIHLYEPKKYKPYYTIPSATEEDINAEVKRANEAGLAIGGRYKTKYNFEVTIEKFGRPDAPKNIFFHKNKPTVVQCVQEGNHGKFPTQFGVDEMLEMVPL